MNLLREVYVSVDIEADGPIPGPNSMLSFGAAAFRPDQRTDPKEPFTLNKNVISTFSANLELLDGATPEPDTMAWWATQPEAWRACRENLLAPSVAMTRFVAWVNSLPGIELGKNGVARNAVFVGYPAGFDFTFVYWYVRRFGLDSPFSFSALDIKTFAMGVLGTSFRESVKRNMPQRWFSNKPHTHVAVDDAIEQGHLFMSMLEEWARRF
jgi:hypothetical protein